MARTSLPGGHSGVEPPDPIPNSDVKRSSADGSVGSPHVRVGHCQALTPKALIARSGLFLWVLKSGSVLTEPGHGVTEAGIKSAIQPAIPRRFTAPHVTKIAGSDFEQGSPFAPGPKGGGQEPDIK